VAGVLELWLPGDAYGTALASLLYGDADPGGRLPITFPANESQGPATTPSTYPGDLSPDGAVETVHFDEGLGVGYRYWDEMGQTPLFPFGHGLSYASFDIDKVRVESTDKGGARVRARVRNTSNRRGSEVLQVYLGFPDSAGEPPRQLKAMAKVTLDPRQAQQVDIDVGPKAFEIWDSDADRWIVPAGAFEVMLGRSSRDIVASFSVRP
jgi:beta-glucosidase